MSKRVVEVLEVIDIQQDNPGQPTPPPGCSLECGCPRRNAQQSAPEVTDSEARHSPHVAAASSASLDGPKTNTVPPVDAEKSFLADCATTANASSMFPQHCNKAPISLRSDICMVLSCSSVTRLFNDVACSSASAADFTSSEMSRKIA